MQERIDLLIDDITESFYINICRGLFEKDKITFIMQSVSLGKNLTLVDLETSLGYDNDSVLEPIKKDSILELLIKACLVNPQTQIKIEKN